MKVTPLKKKFGKYAPGDEFEFPDKAAKVFIKAGKLQQVQSADLSYQTRMMQATPAAVVVAPYGVKADGTPRRRPGRPAASE
jgi:hypothetical protein